MDDFMDAVHPGLKQVLNIAAKIKNQIADRIQMNVTEDEWNLSHNLFVLLKKKRLERPAQWLCASREITASKRGES